MFSFKKKSSTLNPNQDPSKTVVSSGDGHRLSIVVKRRISIGFILLIVIAVGGFVAIKYGPLGANGVALQIDDQKFTHKQIDDYLKYPTQTLKQSRKDATETLINYLKIKVAADKLKIKPTGKELDAEYLNAGAKAPYSDKWVSLVTLVNAIGTIEQQSNATAISGYSYIFFFGNKAIAGPADSPAKGYGDKKQIETDRAYAKQQADKYYEQMRKGASVAQKTLDQVRADPRLSIDYVPGSSYSVRFGKDSSKRWQSQVFYPEVVSAIVAQKKPGLSSNVATGKVSDTNAFYYFFFLDQSKLTTKDKMDAEIQSLKVKRYGI